MSETSKKPRLVGEFIRKRRSDLGLSQRALGQKFNPPVTTQFISNVERGVTPLPPIHVPTLCETLQIRETELTGLMEREFTLKLSDRLGKPGEVLQTGMSTAAHFPVERNDYDFMARLYSAYKNADEKTRQTFLRFSANLLNLQRQ